MKLALDLLASPWKTLLESAAAGHLCGPCPKQPGFGAAARLQQLRRPRQLASGEEAHWAWLKWQASVAAARQQILVAGQKLQASAAAARLQIPAACQKLPASVAAARPQILVAQAGRKWRVFVGAGLQRALGARPGQVLQVAALSGMA